VVLGAEETFSVKTLEKQWLMGPGAKHIKRSGGFRLMWLWPYILKKHWVNFFFNKTNRCTNFPYLFCQETLHVSGSSSAHHQKSSTGHSALVHVKQVWWELSSTTILVMFESCRQTCMTYNSAECTVEDSWRWAEELRETCRLSWQNKFGKLLHLLVLLKRHLLRCTVTWT
jgi:queuine/archaeosine tRNA-ribosyltransferase